MSRIFQWLGVGLAVAGLVCLLVVSHLPVSDPGPHSAASIRAVVLREHAWLSVPGIALVVGGGLLVAAASREGE